MQALEYTPDDLNHKRLFAADKVRFGFFVPISIKFIENQIKALWTRWLKVLTNTVGRCVCTLFSFACFKQVNAGFALLYLGTISRLLIFLFVRRTMDCLLWTGGYQRLPVASCWFWVWLLLFFLYLKLNKNIRLLPIQLKTCQRAQMLNAHFLNSGLKTNMKSCSFQHFEPWPENALCFCDEV